MNELASANPTTVLVAVAAETDGKELAAQVTRLGHDVITARSPAIVADALARRPVGAAVVDFGQSASVDFVAQLARDCPDLRMLLIQPASDPGAAARAIASGASEVITRPFTEAELQRALAKVLAEATVTANEPPDGALTGQLLGQSKAMQKVHELLRRAASGTATVLIRGESGTGKELAARTLHELSPRRSGPFVKVHCAALPDTLLESELFGYERGAFTGALTRKQGRVELAQGGTLLLDEVGDITLAMQVKLLHVLQDKAYERLGGGGASISADVRFVAATHRDLDAMVRQGEFREDLFYRLNVVTSWLPPLRARRDDIAILSRHFCASFGASNGKPSVSLTESAVDFLRSQRWPGNVRQLQNFIEKMVVLCEHPAISREDMEREIALETMTFTTQGTTKPDTLPASSSSDGPESAPVVTLSEELRQVERHALLRALRHTGGNRTLAARVLGVSRATLYKKLDEHGLT